MRYKILYNNSELGPMTANQMLSYNVNEDTMVSKDNGPWRPLYSYPELMVLLKGINNTQPHPGRYNPEVSSKKTLCGILAILFGGLGIQYFVLGKVGGGLITILITLVTCGCWSVVMLIQGIMMLLMSDEDFYRKYMASTSVLPLF